MRRRSANANAWLAFVLGAAACTGTIGEQGSSDRAEGEPRRGAPGLSGNGIPGATGGTASNEPYVASESVARRMSQAELDNTVRDLFGDDTGPASQFLAEDEFSPFDNDYTLQQASAALIDSLEVMAEDVAARLVADPALRARIAPCTPTGPGDAACFRQVVETTGRMAFRRALSTEEVDAYMTLQSFATEDIPEVNNDFFTAVELFVRSVLQDPEFLYRIETGKETAVAGVFALDSHEIASRMSYLLWGSTPDDALLSAAEQDALEDADDRRAAAVRLLDDPRARRQLHRFHSMWLGYRAIPVSADLVAGFNTETTRLIDRVVFEDQSSYLDLFRAEETYLNDQLADHYGLPRPGGEGWVPYGDSGRAGILSHGSVLASFSKFVDTSPTQRGILVRTRLMCERIEPPPATVDADEPPGDDTALCKYDRYEEHRTTSSCAACHSLMDPIGFGLENYDVAGRWRDHDEGLPQCVIAGEGELPGYGTFSGPAELGQKLIESQLLDECAMEQYLTFAVGRSLAPNEDQRVAEMLATFREGDHGLTDLLVDYVASDAFALRREPEVAP